MTLFIDVRKADAHEKNTPDLMMAKFYSSQVPQIASHLSIFPYSQASCENKKSLIAISAFFYKIPESVFN